MIEINDINRHQLIGKVNFPTLTWDDVIFNLNKNVLYITPLPFLFI